MEKLIYGIITSRLKRYLVIAIVLLSLAGSVMMFPTKLVLAKMLPGKSANTFTVYIDLPVDSTVKQTERVAECVLEELKKEPEIMDMVATDPIFGGLGIALIFGSIASTLVSLFFIPVQLHNTKAICPKVTPEA